MRCWIAMLVGLVVSSDAFAGGVAVLYFQNQGNAALEPLKVGLAQMLVTDLKSGTELPVVERAEIQGVLDELKLGHDGFTDPASAARVGRLVGAEYLVMGSYFELLGTLRIDTRVVEVETGKIVFAYGADDPTSGFLAMEKEIAGALGTSLSGLVKPDDKGAARPAPATRAEAVASVGTPVVTAERKTFDAAVAYSEGLIHLDQKDLPRARESFEKALAADPQLDAAKAELARMQL